jgi:hypothetical protein
MKTLLVFLTFLIANSIIVQKTFRIDPSFLDTVVYKKYKAFIVSEEFDIDFTGKKISKSDRFTPSIAEARAADSAIRTQYADAVIHHLDRQYSEGRLYGDTAGLAEALTSYKQQRSKRMLRAQKVQDKKVEKFDRYFWGYRNADNEKLILVRFDPHKIRYFTIGGERHMDVLTILVYNIDKNVLRYSGWADFKQ